MPAKVGENSSDPTAFNFAEVVKHGQANSKKATDRLQAANNQIGSVNFEDQTGMFAEKASKPAKATMEASHAADQKE